MSSCYHCKVTSLPSCQIDTESKRIEAVLLRTIVSAAGIYAQHVCIHLPALENIVGKKICVDNRSRLLLITNMNDTEFLNQDSRIESWVCYRARQ